MKKSEIIIYNIFLIAFLSFKTFTFTLFLFSGTEIVQVKIKETANFTWKFDHYSQISFKYILKDMQETLAAKTPRDKADINPKISEDFKNRISFNVDDKQKTVTFLLNDVTEKDDGKTFELEIETKTKIIKASKKLTIVGKLKIHKINAMTIPNFSPNLPAFGHLVWLSKFVLSFLMFLDGVQKLAECFHCS